MKIYSYLDSGKAVLATRLAPHTQVLDDAIAYLVTPSPAAMAAGMIALLNNVELRKNLGRKARLRVQKEYSRQAFRRKLADFYRFLEETTP